MTTFKEQLNLENTDDVEAITFEIEPIMRYDFNTHKSLIDDKWEGLQEGKVYSYKEALPFLEVDFDAGYGGQDCPNMVVWTKDHIYYVHEYDGSTSLDWVPRNPPNKFNPLAEGSD